MNNRFVSMIVTACVAVVTSCSNKEAVVYTVEDAPGYNCWPMIQPIGERLVCIYTVGKDHDTAEKGRGAYARYSDNGGLTWSERFLIDENPGYGTSSVGKGTDSQGNALFWIRRMNTEPRMALYRTADGKSFELVSTPSLDPDPMQITDIFHTPQGLECLWFSDDYSEERNNKSWGALISRDNGATWEQRIIEENLPKKDWPTEPSVAVISNGRLLAVARSEMEGGRQFQLTSTDWGKTWEKTVTNIDDVLQSTPSLIYDREKGMIYNYYYQRGAGLLKVRTACVNEIMKDGSAWPEPQILAEGGKERPYDSGNANAAAIGSRHFITYYSGDPVNCKVLVAAHDSPSLPDEPIGSLSDPSVELMSHDFRYVGEYDGWHYGIYNAGYKSTKEHPKNLDIDMKLSRWKTGDVDHREVSSIWKTGQGITDDFRPPYDPTGIIEGNTLHILFCPGVDGCTAYVHVPYDLEKKELGKEEVMTLDGSRITVANVLENYKSRTGIDIPWFSDGGGKTGFGIGMNVEIVRHKGYFYCVVSANAQNFTCMIARSKDLVNWETVCVPDLSQLHCGTTYWEGVVHPLFDDTFAFTIRVQNRNGVIYGTWNAATNRLSDLQLIEGSITARPEFFEYKGDTYLFCNTYGPSDIEGYGSVYRATSSFFKLSPDGRSIKYVRSKFVPEGVHYPTFYVEPGRLFRPERLYIVYSTDSRRLDPGEARSNIALERLELE